MTYVSPNRDKRLDSRPNWGDIVVQALDAIEKEKKMTYPQTRTMRNGTEATILGEALSISGYAILVGYIMDGRYPEALTWDKDDGGLLAPASDFARRVRDDGGDFGLVPLEPTPAERLAELPEYVQDMAKELMSIGRKVSAVKFLRAASGLGLAAAKEMAEVYPLDSSRYQNY